MPTVGYFKTKYFLLGFRRAIPKFFEYFRTTFDFPTSVKNGIVISLIKKKIAEF